MEINIRGAKTLKGVNRVFRNEEGELDVALQHGEELTVNGITFRSQDEGIVIEVADSWLLVEPKGEFTFTKLFPKCELMGDSELTRVDFRNNGWEVIVLLTEGKAFISFD